MNNMAKGASLIDHFHLHFVVLLFGFTGILGKLITLGSTELVFFRMLIACIGIGLIAQVLSHKLRIHAKGVLHLGGIGVIVALHWITFFEAIKVSNVSLALGCMASTTLFTSLLEPLIEKRKVDPLEVVIGIIVILGLYLIFEYAFNFWLGIVYALVSSFLASLFGVLNKQIANTYTPTVISFYEMLSGFIMIGIYTILMEGAFWNHLEWVPMDIVYLLLLGLVCTSYAYVAIVFLLKKISAYTVALAINMEPVYAIVFAFLIFGDSEKMHPGFYVGTLIILLSIILYPILKKKWQKMA